MRYDMLEHANMKAMRDKHPNWFWNRSDTHVILGVPGTLDGFKTPVEPGNSFSPGPGTYGVSTWIHTGDRLYVPETMPIQTLTWQFEDGFLPLLHASWTAGPVRVRSSLFTDGDETVSDIRDYLTLTLENDSAEAVFLDSFLVLRSFGASGNAIKSLARDNDILLVNDAPCVYLCDDGGEFGALSYEESGEDIGCLLARGEMPKAQAITDPSGWASGAVRYHLTLAPGEKREISFVFHLQAGHWMFSWRDRLSGPFNLASIRTAFLDGWRNRLPIRLYLPDNRFAEALQCQLVHLAMFTVHDQPRISPVSYPLWWLRDGAYVVNALNKGGLHSFSEKACRGVAHKLAFGGFGSEGDAPGELIWILSEHYLLTKDRTFLHDVYPNLKRQADLLIRMRHAQAPVKVMTEHVIPQLVLAPNIDMLCLPAHDGLIMGRMDNHFPILWVNSFAYLGLSRMVLIAREMGEDTAIYEKEAKELKQAILEKSRDIFGQNDRDVNCAFWPTGWADRDDAFLMSKFDEFWEKVRCPGGVHQPETMWTYFEAGQAHNNVLNGHPERAWVSLDMFLNHHTAQGLYTYHEADADENSSLQWQRTRGWDDIHYITPHGWTAAELFLLMRDCLLYERENELVIGAGIPDAWLFEDFSFENVPTYFGPVSVHYSSAEKTFSVSGPGLANIRLVCAYPVQIKAMPAE